MTPMRTAVPLGRLSPLIHIDSVRRDGVLTIRLSGELDCATEAATRRALIDCLAARRPTELIIDLAQLGFCDCAGARVLQELQHAAEGHDVPCVFTNPQSQVGWLLRIVGMAELLAIDADGSSDTSAPPSRGD